MSELGSILAEISLAEFRIKTAQSSLEESRGHVQRNRAEAAKRRQLAAQATDAKAWAEFTTQAESEEVNAARSEEFVREYLETIEHARTTVTNKLAELERLRTQAG